MDCAEQRQFFFDHLELAQLDNGQQKPSQVGKQLIVISLKPHVNIPKDQLKLCKMQPGVEYSGGPEGPPALTVGRLIIASAQG